MRRVEKPLPIRAPRFVASAFRRFIEAHVSGGLVLLAAIAIAIIWANVPGNSYNALWDSEMSLSFRGSTGGFSVRDVVDQGLMTFFFLFVALEIKRELLVGELSSFKRASLPLFAALGGMAFPALIYLALNQGHDSQGWAIPIATDIALVSGMMSLLRHKLSGAMHVFMLALAIIDDIVAILVIALYYSGAITLPPVLAIVAIVGLLAAMNLLGIRHVWVYGTLGFLLWLAVLQAHIQATLAGVLLALAIPSRSRLSPQVFIRSGRDSLERFELLAENDSCVLCTEEMGELAQEIRVSASHVRAPLSVLEDTLRNWVVFFVMPIFALANGGIELNTSLLRGMGEPVVLGIILGLIAGKQLGIFLLARAAVWLHIAQKPANTSWWSLYSASWLGGIGFTVAIFIAHLAFSDSALLPSIKAGILIASLVSGLGSWLLLRLVRTGWRPRRSPVSSGAI
ncbi:MAG: Na+/H+ antiporter NhaA [Actinobacteria bacterium]|nr:Na+/H+ antiporter NhaA [Actinomycetota bacterium]